MIKAFVFDAYGTLYDVQSVADVTDAAYPGYGDYITQVWRMKQLEYSWLRSMMGTYQDFWAVTLESLDYTLKTIGLAPSQALFDDIASAYNRLTPYADAQLALQKLSGHRLAILSNGSPGMLSALTQHSGFDRHLERVISVDSKRIFKPYPQAYALVEEELNLRRDEVVFVSSNGFDVCGAKNYGFQVARIERVPPAALAEEIAAAKIIEPRTMFKALRLQSETNGPLPDFKISSLLELSELVANENLQEQFN